jgi:hypothetical protein
VSHGRGNCLPVPPSPHTVMEMLVGSSSIFFLFVFVILVQGRLFGSRGSRW